MSQNTTQSPSEQWSIIHTYTRAQALDDGVLVAADPVLAAEAGWRHPVAYTAAVHGATIAWSEQTDADKGVESCQDQAGREFDVLRMAMLAVRHSAPGRNRLPFTVYVVPPTGKAVRSARTTLVIHAGPGDDGDPVVTIMEPGED